MNFINTAVTKPDIMSSRSVPILYIRDRTHVGDIFKMVD